MFLDQSCFFITVIQTVIVLLKTQHAGSLPPCFTLYFSLLLQNPCRNESGLHLFSLVDFLSEVIGNNVEFLLAVGSYDSGELLLGALLVSGDDTELLELLKGISDDLSSSVDVVGSSGTVSLLATEEVLEVADTAVGSKVNLSGNSSYKIIRFPATQMREPYQF